MTHAAGSTATAARPQDRALFEGSGWPLIVFIWAIYAGAVAIGGFHDVIDRLSTDDAMRLAEVRDLLAGQSWWDLTQYRLNPPDGVVMHWSRVIDLPIAAILWTLGHVVSDDLAVRLTITIWPLLLLLPALLAAASACRTLAGPQAAVLGAFMMVMSPAVTCRYAIAGIDHHGAQVALALTLLACALRMDRSVKAAVGAGLSAAVMMAIGMETAPHVAACAGFIAFRWAVTGDAGLARGARWFGLTFGAGTALIAVATLAPASWLAPVCDTLGFGHIVVAAIGGAGLAASSLLTRGGAIARISALGLVAIATAVGLYLVAPNCISSPYGALPQKLQDDWLAHVQEAQPFIASFRDDPTSGVAIGLPLLVMIGVSLWALFAARRDQRWNVATAVVMCAAACAVTLWQIRGASLAFALGGPLLPMAVLAIGRTGGRVRTVLAMIALTPATLALAGLGAALAAGLPPVEAINDPATKCTASDYRAFERLPAGTALNNIDSGPFVIAFSRHSALAAPYHRNVSGLMSELEAFEGNAETAKAVALTRQAAYVVLCPSDGGVRVDPKLYPDSFGNALVDGKAPSWLEPVDLGPGARLRVYRVLAGR